MGKEEQPCVGLQLPGGQARRAVGGRARSRVGGGGQKPDMGQLQLGLP